MIQLVTGGSGFVGAALTRLLAQGRETVRLLLRPTSSTDLLAPVVDRIEIVHGDVGDPEGVARAMNGVDEVYHCAGRVGFTRTRDADRLHSVNVRGTAHVVDAALRAGVRRLLHVSSVAALGRPDRPTGCVDETASWTESRNNTEYGRTKYLAEQEVQRAVAEGLEAVIVNPALVFGPGRPGENTMRIVEAVRSGRVRRYPTGLTTVVDVDDVAEGILLAMQRGVSGRRYVLGGDNLEWRQVLGHLADALGVRGPRRPASRRSALLAATASECLASLVGRRPSLTRDAVRTSFASVCFDSSRARSEIGWAPRPFPDTAARIARHLGR